MTKTWFKFSDPTKQDKAFPMWGYGTAVEATTYAEMDGVTFVEMESHHVVGVAALPNSIPESRRFYISEAIVS
jgi:hypothetical protein